MISPLAYKALTSIQTPSQSINLNMPALQESVGQINLPSNNFSSNSLFTLYPAAGLSNKSVRKSPMLSAQNRIKLMNSRLANNRAGLSKRTQRFQNVQPRIVNRSKAISVGLDRGSSVSRYNLPKTIRIIKPRKRSGYIQAPKTSNTVRRHTPQRQNVKR